MQPCRAASGGTNVRTALLKRVFAGGLSGRPCLFLDRDGVINERREGGYVTTWEEFLFRPGAIDALRSAATHLTLVVVTNQRCVARGIASAAQIESLMDRMCEELRGEGVEIAAWYACPHDIIDDCECRKPRPGMLLEASLDLGIALESAFMVGDSQSDVDAGNAAGCKQAFFCDPAQPAHFFEAIRAITGGAVHAV